MDQQFRTLAALGEDPADSQHPQGSSQLSVISAPGDPLPSSTSTGTCTHVCTHRQTHIHTNRTEHLRTVG